MLLPKVYYIKLLALYVDAYTSHMAISFDPDMVDSIKLG